MAEAKKIVECVPNFSEGRDKQKIEQIVDHFRGKEGVKLLDYSNDEDHNRLVVTVVGEPKAVKEAVFQAVGTAIQLIDLNHHEGQHPRMGATDVIPFIPIKNMDVQEAVNLSKELAQKLWEHYNLPIFLYEESASSKDRKNLSTIRKGQFEGMNDKMKLPEWRPDYGNTEIHPTAGVTAVGARMPLIAFNVNLGTSDFQVADFIAKKVRHIGGGFRFVKAMGVSLEERGIVQVSMNLTNYQKSTIYAITEAVRMEAKRFGVSVVGTELIGLAPMEALIDSAVYYLGIENFSMDQVLESRIME